MQKYSPTIHWYGSSPAAAVKEDSERGEYYFASDVDARIADLERIVGCGPHRSDDQRDMASVIAHLRFGDSDGQDHDDAADELERLRLEVAETAERLREALPYVTEQALRERISQSLMVSATK